MGDWNRPLTEEERAWIASARQTTHTLYEGRTTPHRSCGIAMAETYGRPTAAYQALRRGGITGCGECGVIVGARLVLGEIFGDPDPTGPTTPALLTAMTELEARWRDRMDRGPAPGTDIVCNTLTSPYADFRGPERAGFCTRLSADISELLAEVIVRNGGMALAAGGRPE
ncbi:MAG: C_GCAxxG_C_C family protein [Alphaproteobacteria bacterium]|nr:C_GCAxxG_C_C family protein [Alphaproteobacteria bacterium]MCB9697518.1 C_GCAxxG_C_C family protein [Alphaproteobacteria bacterium]